MGDMGEYFRDLDEHHKERRGKHLLTAEKTFEGFIKHTEWHWSMMLDGDRLDYWPTSCRWRWRDKTTRGDANNLVGFIAKRKA